MNKDESWVSVYHDQQSKETVIAGTFFVIIIIIVTTKTTTTRIVLHQTIAIDRKGIYKHKRQKKINK